jgi:hypothetical protein
MEMDSPIALFKKAEQLLRENGFSGEIDWCENRPSLNQMVDSDILREYAWVVFNSGMSNAVIEAKWQDICKAFRFFNLKLILEEQDAVLSDALNIFGHYKKVNAIIQFCKKLWKESFAFKQQVSEDPLVTLAELPFIGNKTKYHLARNLGFDFVKPDRHLQRLADQYCMTPFKLCNLIHKETGRRLGTIDVILWRFCEQQGKTRAVKSRH